MDQSDYITISYFLSIWKRQILKSNQYYEKKYHDNPSGSIRREIYQGEIMLELVNSMQEWCDEEVKL